MIQIVCYLLTAYLFVVFARVVLSWFPLDGNGVMSTVQDVLITVTEPLLGPIRRALPQPGGIPIDLSPIVVMLGIFILRALLGCG
jgi:YggT family protein